MPKPETNKHGSIAKELTGFRVEKPLLVGLRQIKVRTGLPIALQVNLALRAWIKNPVLPTLTHKEQTNGKS